MRLQPGRALSVLNDGGWGGLVRKGLEAAEFADALVEAAAELVGEAVAAGSAADVGDVRAVDVAAGAWWPGFAERLAAALGLPFRPVVVKTRETKPQAASSRTRSSSSRTSGTRSRSTGVSGGGAGAARRRPRRLAVDAHGGRRAALLEAGSGPVSPFVLAKSVSD